MSQMATSLARLDDSSSSGAASSRAAPEAAAAPAVMVADAIGRAVNDRVKVLSFKARESERMRAARERWYALQATAAGQSSDQGGRSSAVEELVPGPALESQMARWQEGVAAATSKAAQGQARLAALRQRPKLRKPTRAAVEATMRGVRWEPEARIKVAHIRASVALCELVAADEALRAGSAVKSPPMLVPPVPWRGPQTGGYLTMRHWMMRTRMSHNIQQALRDGAEAVRNKDRPEPLPYQDALDALNVLGRTAWRINRPVLTVMEALWAAKEQMDGLPDQTVHKYPPRPSTAYRLAYEGGTLHARAGPPTSLERRQWTLATDDVRKARRNAASLVADFQLKFQVAREYAGEPEFYYPHNVDFRGRAYPIHPTLHHLGDDMCRGLLTFANGKPLGLHGLDWLKVHLANLWGNGVDKLTLDKRKQFTQENLNDVLLSAHDPLNHKWWRGAEKPWQCLAACFEVSNALAHGVQGDCASYISHLPVHQDGSCNGLQHYAALGRDEVGAKAVNLLPADSPQDVYKGVAALVAQHVERDAQPRIITHPDGTVTHVPPRLEARRIAGHVDRKLVKQTVMTSVYGVTAVGAREQVQARLRERGWDNREDKDALWLVSRYVAGLTLDALGEMFKNAREIMRWLADCASLVAGEGVPVQWTSPVGLPIVQPYHRVDPLCVRTISQTFSIVREGADKDAPVTKARQRSAFPPNYIHSLDSAHMMRTAVACAQQGIEFAGVHDSFWAHAGCVDIMGELLRKEFVKLHDGQQDLLERLHQELAARHPNVQFPPVPQRGELKIARVVGSRYFFS